MAETAKPRIVGRSSSHFTRVTRIFASELGVEYQLSVVHDLSSLRPPDYAGNPALKVPILETADGAWFGALNICRELTRLSKRDLRVVWPEALLQPLLANAQELTVHAMATEVVLIMSAADEAGVPSAGQVKARASLVNAMTWLDANIGKVLAGLPADRDLSYLEVALYCLVTHLEFRHVLPTAEYKELLAFCGRFSERESARETHFRFDAREG
jgi:glutathione S-transferase